MTTISKYKERVRKFIFFKVYQNFTDSPKIANKTLLYLKLIGQLI